MTPSRPHVEQRRHTLRSQASREGEPSQPLELLLALDRAVVEVSMQLYNVNERDRSEMRLQNRRLHAAVRDHLLRLIKRARQQR